MRTEDAVMLTDRLLSVLREAGRPMSTVELAELMPWKERTVRGFNGIYALVRPEGREER